MGRESLTYFYVKEQIEKEDYRLLSNKYIGAHFKLEYRCPENHYHSMCWGNWQQGQRCPVCAGNAKPDIEYIKKTFGKEDYKLLSNKYVNSYSKLKYKCSEGHYHSISWDNWKQGCRCPTCANINNSGANNPAWNGGTTRLNELIRKSCMGEKWRNEIFKRDNYICKACNKRGGDLHAHHIVPVKDIIETYNLKNIKDAKKCKLLYDISNGVTLCKDCHIEYHNLKRKGG